MGGRGGGWEGGWGYNTQKNFETVVSVFAWLSVCKKEKECILFVMKSHFISRYIKFVF